MRPGERHVISTYEPGLNPARSSHRPIKRIFGLAAAFQRLPSASIFNDRALVGLFSLLSMCESSLGVRSVRELTMFQLPIDGLEHADLSFGFVIELQEKNQLRPAVQEID